MSVILIPASLIGAALLAQACSTATPDVVVRFELENSGAVHESAQPVVRSLQFYVHEVELRDAAGVWRRFEPSTAPDRQTARVALVELAKAPQAQLRGRIADGGGAPYSAIRFTVGVPFDLNHANPLTAKAPLDRGELFWSWQLGYKFLRVDLADGDREWSFHLGSTGCVSASSVRPPAAPCAQPNRLRVQLEGFDPTRAPVRVQLHELIEAMRAAQHVSCTGGYASTPACAAPYERTGLDALTGVCAGEICGEQRLFAAPPRDRS